MDYVSFNDYLMSSIRERLDHTCELNYVSNNIDKDVEAIKSLYEENKEDILNEISTRIDEDEYISQSLNEWISDAIEEVFQEKLK